MDPPKGELKFQFVPLPLHPMTFALLIILGIVATLGIPRALGDPEESRTAWLWFLPFFLVVTLAILGRPSPTRIYGCGVEPSLPLWRRLLGHRRFYPFDEIRNIYPKPYYVGGAAMSPFAASAGTVEHIGVGIETKGGREFLLAFTPSLPGFVQGPSEGYRLAMDHLEAILDERGQPMVQDPPTFTAEQLGDMKREVLRPLMAFHIIVLAFFSPIALLPLAFLAIGAMGWDGYGPLLYGVVVLGLLPLILMVVLTWRRSLRRHQLLREISKAETARSTA